MEDALNRVREVLESPAPETGDIIDDFKQSIYNKEIFNSKNIVVNLSNHPNGLYLVKTTNVRGSSVSKVLKK